MLAVVASATVLGIDAVAIRVEVDISPGLPGFATVGLPENTVKEARVRVQAATANSGYIFPSGRITVNLAPANLRKDGTGFDLAIALGILAAQGTIPLELSCLGSYRSRGRFGRSGVCWLRPKLRLSKSANACW
jgi:magnesium chelatase family protein